MRRELVFMKTKTIILYEKYFDYAENFTDEQLGKVVRALGKFFFAKNDSVAEAFQNDEKLFFAMMRDEIKVNLDKYDEICKKRSKAGEISAAKRRHAEQMLTCVNNNNNNNKNKNNNKNNNKNKNKNINNNIGAYDFEEIERLALERRIKNKTP